MGEGGGVAKTLATISVGCSGQPRAFPSKASGCWGGPAATALHQAPSAALWKLCLLGLSSGLESVF